MFQMNACHRATVAASHVVCVVTVVTVWSMPHRLCGCGHFAYHGISKPGLQICNPYVVMDVKHPEHQALPSSRTAGCDAAHCSQSEEGAFITAAIREMAYCILVLDETDIKSL